MNPQRLSAAGIDCTEQGEGQKSLRNHNLSELQRGMRQVTWLTAINLALFVIIAIQVFFFMP
jgi:hypothetical protein